MIKKLYFLLFLITYSVSGALITPPTVSIGFDTSASYTFTSETLDFTGVNNLLLPPTSVTMCCENAFVITDENAKLASVESASTNQPQTLAIYNETPIAIKFYDIANGDFWAEGIGQSGTIIFAPLTGAGVSSGTLSAVDPTTENQSIWGFTTSSTVNSGYSLLSL